MLPVGLAAACELAEAGQQPPGGRGPVVAGVQDVGLPALPLLQPHEVGAGWEEGPGSLPVQLEHHPRGPQHHPQRDQHEVCQQETGSGRSLVTAWPCLCVLRGKKDFPRLPTINETFEQRTFEKQRRNCHIL